MFKSKGAAFGVAVALVASALLVAGMAVTSTSGAGTDNPGFGGAPSGFPDISTDPGTGNPPAADEDPAAIPGTTPGSPAGTAPGTQPSTGIDPTGNAGAGGTAPGSLPNAGYGDVDGGNGFGAMIVLLALAGAALVGAGATAVSSRRS